MPRALVGPALARLALAGIVAIIGGPGAPGAVGAAPAPAPASAPASVITPCKPDSAPYREAAQALAALDAQIRALAPDADLRPASAALAALLAHPCLRLAALDAGLDAPRDAGLDVPLNVPLDGVASALALQRFWDDGGEDWLQSYLDAGAPAKDGRQIVVPPAMRPTLSKETHRDHALAPLLCSLADAGCRARTHGWVARAHQAFERFAEDKRAAAVERGKRYRDPQACAREARKARASARYATWRACLDTVTPKTEALPLGGLAVPTHGWLVIHGRRGHYSFCDEIRAYDLATGAAYLAQSCSSLELVQGGGVDQARTDAGRLEKAQAGQVMRDNLREAAWMILLLPFVAEPAVRAATWYDVPAGIAVQRTLGQGWGIGFGGAGFSTAQTTLSWSYLHQGEVLATGTLTWPYHLDKAGRDHAVELLRIAEDSFVAGCPRAALPAGLVSTALTGAAPGVSALDASRSSLMRASDALMDALERLRQRPREQLGCSPAPAAPAAPAPAPAPARRPR